MKYSSEPSSAESLCDFQDCSSLWNELPRGQTAGALESTGLYANNTESESNKSNAKGQKW